MRVGGVWGGAGEGATGRRRMARRMWSKDAGGERIETARVESKVWTRKDGACGRGGGRVGWV